MPRDKEFLLGRSRCRQMKHGNMSYVSRRPSAPTKFPESPLNHKMSAETRIVGSPSSSLPAAESYGQERPPCEIDCYRIEKLVGQGSMGSVFEVQHKNLGRHFALKLMAGSLKDNHEATERFRAETKALGKLDHPNIVRAIDAGDFNGQLYLVTELLEGCDLSTHIARSGPLDPALVVSIATQVSEALFAAHSAGFFHRDIKPSNIFLQSNGQVKLLDFGLVRNVSSGSMTRAGSFMGTVDFVAPEQAGNPTSAGAASDIYSLGCTLIYLLTGQPPFPDEKYPSITAKIHAHLHEPPAWTKNPPAQTPQWLVDLITAMVGKNPDQRPSQCSVVTDALKNHTFTSTAPNLTSPTPLASKHTAEIATKDRNALPVMSKPMIVAGCAIAGAAVVGCFSMIGFPEEKHNSTTQSTSQDEAVGVQSQLSDSDSGSPSSIDSDEANEISASATTLPVHKTQNARGIPQMNKQTNPPNSRRESDRSEQKRFN